jgi:hypothetical protein
VTDFYARIHGLLGGVRPWSMGFHLTGGVTEAALSATFNAAANALFTTAVNGIENLVTADVTTTLTTVATLNATMKQLSFTQATMATTGTAAGNSLPWSSAELVRLGSSTLDIKAARGHIYIPPMAQSELVSHVISAGALASLKAVFDVFFPAIHTSGVQSFVFNRKALKDGTPPFTKRIMDFYELSNKPSTQRGRVRKVIPTFTLGGAF